MKIVLSGIETNNKGAELMLYAILHEIENKYPEAEIYVPIFAIKQGLSYIQTSLNIKEKPFANIIRIAQKVHLFGILRRLHIPYFGIYDNRIIKKANYFIDASGFAFSDQWKPTNDNVEFWRYQLKGYSKQKTKIIFLPQAFGPACLANTKKEFQILNQYADIIMPRERVSQNYLLENNVNPNKIRMYTDFTSLIKGVFPEEYNHLKNGICIIPNMRMIDKGIISLKNYLILLEKIIEKVSSKGYVTYLLNHEGVEDEKLAYLCKNRLQKPIEVVTGLNALEVKGLIASSYLCISSRFHGVASALNSAVPCLATSWSHKYAELFKDYGMNDNVLKLDDLQACVEKVEAYLNKDKNLSIRQELEIHIPQIQNETREMWNTVWNI